MGKGTLTVETRVADDALPISGAGVIIRDKEGKTLYQVTTDSNGKTGSMELYAPDKEHTLNPNDPGPHYGLYDATVSAPGFLTIIIANVQIFDTIDAILPIDMMPATDFTIENNPVRYTIPPPSVEDPGDRFIEDPQTSFVLSEVIIPDYITVHLGTPGNIGARNVRVPFAEYIKNVTSSEIYPTWPEASLLANIHAIVSFVLNRVYTEWYRSRGYAFDITNSTV